jgi:hypothetical protein
MKVLVATLAAAGLTAVLAMPAQADQTQTSSGVTNKAKVEHTDISAQRRYYRHGRYYGPRYRYGGPRYGYYRPYRYGPYAYGPGVSFGFWGGPRLGVWF